jgi:hypothetical protein
MPVGEHSKTREETLVSRFNEIREKYRRGDGFALGEASPDELKELGRVKRELDELQRLINQIQEMEQAEQESD